MTQKEFQVETGLIIHTCIQCGMLYAIPSDFEERRRKDHRTFYCPNGHSMYYAQKNREEILKEELERAETCCEIYKGRAKTRDYRARYYKGQLTKIKNIQKGEP